MSSASSASSACPPVSAAQQSGLCIDPGCGRRVGSAGAVRYESAKNTSPAKSPGLTRIWPSSEEGTRNTSFPASVAPA